MERSRKVAGPSKKAIVKDSPVDIAMPDGIEKPKLVKASNIARRRQAALAEGGADYTAKRDELVQLAVKLFQEKGFKATTLNDLSKASGLERATLYYYVSSKEELLQEAIQGMLKSNLDEAGRIARLPDLGPKEKLQLLFEMLMVSYEENYPHMYVYIQELMHEVPHESSPWAKQMLRQTRNFEKMAMTLIVQGIEEGVFRSDVSARIATNGIFGMFNWTHRWFKPNGKQSGKEVADTFCKIFLEGLSCKTS